ncbi:MAG: Succinyl-diaminopimelate desuccinylase [Chlamydiae bacterium]|nr:Succinyl-diaminopimelate desuccinylase [Chlamydiota bacterium]
MNLSLEYYNKEFDDNKDMLLDEFFQYLRFKTISAQSKYKPEITACVDWLKTYLQAIDLDIEIWDTKKNPCILAQNLKAGEQKPTVLIYLHYDVQPVDPIELWDTPPFEPTLKGDTVYARGACDNKGQAFYTISALRALYKKEGAYPVNLKILIEGEEEIGSQSLQEYLEEKKEQVQADYILIVDVDIPNEETPAVGLGVRGICTSEITLEGPNSDLHSGLFGGIVYNPLQALCEMLAKFHTSDGSVTIPGFYDAIKELSSAEMEELYLDFDEKAFVKELGVKPLGGEKKYSPLERSGLRPTFEINGLWGGYIEEGFKTVIPSKAHAKVSMRLVPDQDPLKIYELFQEHIKSLVPEGFKLTLSHSHAPSAPFRAEFNSKVVDAVSWAYTEVFKTPCKKFVGGGSLPVTLALKEATDAQVIGLGVSLSTDKIHAPNEHFTVSRLKKGFLVISQLIERLGTL